ncbi:MAG TPA: polyketide synthase dehydratase domain-containing protein, partial [Phycisphaerae bacterium]|nr:polyketide synthase dehydratase domain-containing protein [Phycisphaerae bacterium]
SLARTRGALLAEADDGGGAMLAVSAPLDELEACIAAAEADGPVVLANRNAPRQGVVSGPRAAIESLRRLFDLKGWRSSLLQVSAAFHSSFMAPAYERFRAKLERLTFEPPKIPVLANATGRPYTLDPAGMRELLADQLTRPVQFLDEIRHLYQAGVRTFVEVGPRNVLTGLVRSILHDLPHHAIAADMSCGRSCGIADIARVLALVAVLGHAVDLKAWESEPPPLESPSMTVQILGANYRAPAAVGHPQPAAPRDNGRLAMSYEDSTQVRAAVPAPAADRDILRHATNGEANGDGRNGPPATGCEPQVRLNAAAGETDEPPLPGDVLHQALLVAQQGLRGMQTMQQQTAAAHQQFLETQQQAQTSFARLVEAHQRLMERAGGLPAAQPGTEAASPARLELRPASAPPFESPVAPPEPRAQRAGIETAAPVPIGPVVDPVPAGLKPSVPPSQPARTATPPVVEHSPESAPGGQQAQRALREVVAELTGYPVETLRLDMDIEADLGIDSIKRLEVLSTLQRRLPGLSAIDSQQAGSLRTLGDIVRHALPEAASPVSSASPACGASAAGGEAPPANASGAGAPAAGDALLAVVAELTGYPAETLRLDMDIEADLGIDSIKRLEILSTLQRRVPGLRAVDSQELGGLRTLGDMLRQLGPEEPAPRKAAAGAPAPTCGTGSNGDDLPRSAARAGPRSAAEARVVEEALPTVCSRPAPGMTVAFERNIDPERHLFLSSHVIAGRPVLPVVMMLEWLAHGALHANPGLCVARIDDLRVLKGLTFESGVAPLATVLVSAAERRGEGFAVRAELLSAGPRGERLHARAEVLLAERLLAPPPAAGAPADLVWRPRDHAAHEAARAYRDALFHGPLLAAIRELLGAGCGGMVATVRAAPPPVQWMDDPPRDQWIADPLALDGGLQLGLLWCQQFAGLSALPSCLGRVTLHAAAPWPEALTVTLNVRDSDAARLLADLELSAPGGVVATVAGCEWTLSSAVPRGRAAKESRRRRDDADPVSLVEAV